MSNGDPFWHVTRAIDDLRTEMRDMRGDMGHLRDDLAETRETVAGMQGERRGESTGEQRSHRVRDRLVQVSAATGCVLGALAAVGHYF